MIRCALRASGVLRRLMDYSPQKLRRPRRAYTLVEMSITVVIAALIGAIALPRYGQSAAHYRAETAARRIVADLALARSTARSSGSSITVVLTTHGYTLQGVSDRDRPGSTYAVDLRADPYSGSWRSVALNATANNAAVTSVTFDRYGVANAGGSVVVASGTATRTVTLDAATGRAAVQ